MQVLEERTDIAYSKAFFKTSGFITKDWYPCFYAVRRNDESYEKIRAQILRLNPMAEEKTIRKFILG